MRFTIKYRRIDTQLAFPTQTLAIDIDGPQAAGHLVESLAGSFDEHGCDLPPLTHWFRNRLGLHLIWAQPQ